MSDTSELIVPIWSIALEITPTEDMTFAAIRIITRKPGSRVPHIMNSAAGFDMLFERIQGDLNNHLRQVVNDLVRVKQAATKNHR